MNDQTTTSSQELRNGLPGHRRLYTRVPIFGPFYMTAFPYRNGPARPPVPSTDDNRAPFRKVAPAGVSVEQLAEAVARRFTGVRLHHVHA